MKIEEIKEAAVSKEEFQTQPRIPLTIISDDEGYLLEEDHPIDEAEGRHEACGEFLTTEIQAAKPNKKKINDMEQRQKKAKRQARALDGIALLAEAAKKL